MTLFLRLLADREKALNLADLCALSRSGQLDPRIFDVNPDNFLSLPSTAFAYWLSDSMREVFQRYLPLENRNRFARQGLSTADDFRFLRTTWELIRDKEFIGIAKGGSFSPFYSDIYLWLRWDNDGAQIRNFFNAATGKLLSAPRNVELFGRAGLTWPRRTKSRLSMRVLPRGCAFADKGPAIFIESNENSELLFILAVSLSSTFHKLVEVQLAAADARPGGAAHSFEVGVIQSTPMPDSTKDEQGVLATLAHRAWSLKRNLDTVNEVSHAFLLPAPLRNRLGSYHPSAIELELERIQTEIDVNVLSLYGLSDVDRSVAQTDNAVTELDIEGSEADNEDDDEDEIEIISPVGQTVALLSWAVGVAFGRFDWRLATGERVAPPEPDPFDPLSAKSPGMLQDGANPLHPHAGILVDDPSNKHDLARVIEEVLIDVDAPVPADVRRWLQREFFPFHLQRYSKSRRKAPIYWPLATASVGYTLWLYYPDLNSQTLFTAVNDFIEPKLEHVGKEVAALRNTGSARSRDDDKAVEVFQTLEKELVELRDTLLQIAPTYRPNHDDGVQITAAPLWPLFRHKPWQKLLRETWEKLEKGDYDWSHLAMAHWPDRVRKKCKTDKSLAIAHGLEALYEPPPESATGAGRGGRKRRGAAP